jgi:hypothetical protein
MRSSAVWSKGKRAALTVLFTVGLAAGTVGVAAPAFATASGCGVNRWATPPSTTWNTGGATCASLTNGSAVRAVVWCGTTAFPPHYGPWVSTSNTWSKYNCGGSVAVQVNYQVG